VRVSLLEIYNEDIYDLLSPGNGMVKMKIYEDNNRKVGGVLYLTHSSIRFPCRIVGIEKVLNGEIGFQDLEKILNLAKM